MASWRSLAAGESLLCLTFPLWSEGRGGRASGAADDSAMGRQWSWVLSRAPRLHWDGPSGALVSFQDQTGSITRRIMPDPHQPSGASPGGAATAKDAKAAQGSAEWVTRVPDGGWGWLVVAGSFITTVSLLHGSGRLQAIAF